MHTSFPAWEVGGGLPASVPYHEYQAACAASSLSMVSEIFAVALRLTVREPTSTSVPVDVCVFDVPWQTSALLRVRALRPITPAFPMDAKAAQSRHRIRDNGADCASCAPVRGRLGGAVAVS